MIRHVVVFNLVAQRFESIAVLIQECGIDGDTNQLPDLFIERHASQLFVGH